jgi:hypothetical protein
MPKNLYWTASANPLTGRCDVLVTEQRDPLDSLCTQHLRNFRSPALPGLSDYDLERLGCDPAKRPKSQDWPFA